MKIKYLLLYFLLFPICLSAGNDRTSAISSISGESIAKAPVRSLEDALIGRLSGLNAVYTSSGVEFTIRGLQTLSDNGIVILVDGYERPLTMLRTEEIESVSVLKDAAATAIYGYRGVNGILSIKTKRGYGKGLYVNAGYEHLFNTAMRIPKTVGAYSYASALNEARSNDGLPPYYSEAALEAFRTGSMPDLFPDVDWRSEILRNTGHTDVFYADFSGGSDKLKYYAFFNLQFDNGLLKKFSGLPYPVQFKDNRAEVRANIDADVSPTTKLSVNIAGYLGAENSPHGMPENELMSTLYRLPSAAFPVRTPDGMWGGDYYWKDINPVARITATGYDQTNSRMLLADAQIIQDFSFIVKGLSARVRAGFDTFSEFMEQRVTGFEYNRDYPIFNPDGSIGDVFRPANGGNKSGDLTFSHYVNSHWRRTNFDADITYKGQTGNNAYSAILMYSLQNMSGAGVDNTFFRHNLSLVLGYAFKKSIDLSLSLTSSGSNRNFKACRYAVSPVISLSWDISKEDFMRRYKSVDILQLRASAGVLHNDFLPQVNITQQNFAASAGSFIYGSENTQVWGAKEGFLPTINPRIERAFKYNIGFDAGFFKSLRFGIDAYFQNRDRIFVSSTPSLPSVTGVEGPYVNAGKVFSYGVEFSADYEYIRNEFRFAVSGLFSFNRNRIRNTIERADISQNASRIGHSLDQFFGLEATGFFVDENEISSSVLHSFSQVRPGDVMYKNQNEDNIIDANDEIPLRFGKTPEIGFSLNLGFSYKGIGIDAMFQGAANYSTYLSVPGIHFPLVNNANVSSDYLDKCWRPDGSNPNPVYPRLTSKASLNNYRPNSIWIANAAFLKLRYLDLYYDFPQSVVRKLRMENLRIFARGMNLFSVDGIRNMDPESVGTGMPVSRTMSLGIAVNF